MKSMIDIEECYGRVITEQKLKHKEPLDQL